MPTSPYTASEMAEVREVIKVMLALDDDDEDDEELNELLLLFACEPLQRTLAQDIGPERFSLARLRREAAERGRSVDEASVTLYIKFGFRLDWLHDVVAALEVPDEVETDGGHLFSGDEVVLLMLYRVRCPAALRSMTWDCGRSISAISEAVWYMVRAACRHAMPMRSVLLSECVCATGGAHPQEVRAPRR